MCAYQCTGQSGALGPQFGGCESGVGGAETVACDDNFVAFVLWVGRYVQKSFVELDTRLRSGVAEAFADFAVETFGYEFRPRAHDGGCEICHAVGDAVATTVGQDDEFVDVVDADEAC